MILKLTYLGLQLSRCKTSLQTEKAGVGLKTPGSNADNSSSDSCQEGNFQPSFDRNSLLETCQNCAKTSLTVGRISVTRSKMDIFYRQSRWIINLMAAENEVSLTSLQPRNIPWSVLFSWHSPRKNLNKKILREDAQETTAEYGSFLGKALVENLQLETILTIESLLCSSFKLKQFHWPIKTHWMTDVCCVITFTWHVGATSII